MHGLARLVSQFHSFVQARVRGVPGSGPEVELAQHGERKRQQAGGTGGAGGVDDPFEELPSAVEGLDPDIGDAHALREGEVRPPDGIGRHQERQAGVEQLATPLALAPDDERLGEDPVGEDAERATHPLRPLVCLLRRPIGQPAVADEVAGSHGGHLQDGGSPRLVLLEAGGFSREQPVRLDGLPHEDQEGRVDELEIGVQLLALDLAERLCGERHGLRRTADEVEVDGGLPESPRPKVRLGCQPGRSLTGAGGHGVSPAQSAKAECALRRLEARAP